MVSRTSVWTPAYEVHVTHGIPRVLLVLLVFVPLAMLLHFVAPRTPHLHLCRVRARILPLAAFIGHATEVLAEHLGAGIGGLLNATFGNAAERSSASWRCARN